MDYSVPESKSIAASSQLIEVPCFTTLPRSDTTPLDFRVDKSDLHIDPANVFLYIKAVFEKDDATVEVYPANNLAYSMWQNVEMYLSDQKITMDQTLYPWLGYVIGQTQFSKQYRDTSMQTSLWYADTWGTMDTATADNIGAQTRKSKTDGIFELYSKVLTDFVQLPRLLPSQIEVLFRFIPANPSLYLITKTAPKMKILDAKLYVSKVCLTLPLSIRLKYPVSRFHGRTKTVNAGEQNVEWVPYSGNCPRRLYFMQVLQKTYNGQSDRNIFNLQTFGIKNIHIYLNDISLPMNIASSFSKSNVCRSYLNTTRAVDAPQAWNISLDAFANGYFLYVVDLTSDHQASANYVLPHKPGTVRFSIDYDKPLSDAITMICFIEVDDVLTLDQYNNPSWS